MRSPTGTLLLLDHHVSMLYTAGVMLVLVFENTDGRPPSSSRSSRVIELGANRKPICNFLLVT